MNSIGNLFSAEIVNIHKNIDLLDSLRKDGYSRVKINGEVRDLSEDIILEKNKKDKEFHAEFSQISIF